MWSCSPYVVSWKMKIYAMFVNYNILCTKRKGRVLKTRKVANDQRSFLFHCLTQLHMFWQQLQSVLRRLEKESALKSSELRKIKARRFDTWKLVHVSFEIEGTLTISKYYLDDHPTAVGVTIQSEKAWSSGRWCWASGHDHAPPCAPPPGSPPSSCPGGTPPCPSPRGSWICLRRGTNIGWNQTMTFQTNMQQT